MTSKPHRLPEHVRPRSYHVHIRAAPGEARFRGSVRIEVEVAEPTAEVELHARDLTLTRVAAEQGQRFEGKAEVRKETESAVLRFPQPLKQGKAVLDLSFEAPVAPAMQGLYLSKDGPEQCLVTQCEATDARAVFPCFDEPAFKATLAWTVTAPPGMQVLANGPLLGKRTEPDGWVTWDFAATPPISSYLAAVAIGAFGGTPEAFAGGIKPGAASPEGASRRVPFRVWAMEGKEHLGAAARDAAARMMPWYEDYFGVPYQYGKYDQLAVPSFAFGAMENAGLVVFRASRLLMDPRTASWRDQRDITLVVAHEFAHQWFGNHVTMRWWDDLWLNESFAEWIAHRCADALWPEHEVWLDFQARTSRALATDALGATHPIYQPVQTPAEAAELFDAITYGKGSAVLRMLEAFLGAEAFRAGLRTYMREFGGANAAGADLWRHLGQAAKQPVERIMQDWVAQPGHPVVHLSAHGSRLKVRQQRFRSAPGAPAGEQVWPVPLVLRWADDAGVHTHAHLLAEPEGEVALPARGAVQWVHANAGDLGFYRTDPDDALLAALQRNLAALAPAERAGLLRDQWALARSGARPVPRFFAFMAALVPHEAHYAALEQAADIARDAERLLEVHGEAQALEAYRAWVGRTFAPVLKAAGPDARPGEPPAQGLLRAAAYRAVAGVARDRSALEEAQRLAARERADPEGVDPNLAGTVVALAAQHGDAARFDEHVGLYKARRGTKRPPQEADRYLGSFVAFREPALVARALDLLEDGTVPKQSIGPLLVAMLREPHAQRASWARVQPRWKALREQLGDSWAANIVEATGALPPPMRRAAEGFLEAHAGDFVQSRARALDLLAEREAVFSRVVPELAAWARGG